MQFGEGAGCRLKGLMVQVAESAGCNDGAGWKWRWCWLQCRCKLEKLLIAVLVQVGEDAGAG